MQLKYRFKKYRMKDIDLDSVKVVNTKDGLAADMLCMKVQTSVFGKRWKTEGYSTNGERQPYRIGLFGNGPGKMDKSIFESNADIIGAIREIRKEFGEDELKRKNVWIVFNFYKYVKPFSLAYGTGYSFYFATTSKPKTIRHTIPKEMEADMNINMAKDLVRGNGELLPTGIKETNND